MRARVVPPPPPQAVTLRRPIPTGGQVAVPISPPIEPTKRPASAAISRTAQPVMPLPEPSPALTELAESLELPWAERVVRIVIEPARMVVDYA